MRGIKFCNVCSEDNKLFKFYIAAHVVIIRSHMTPPDLPLKFLYGTLLHAGWNPLELYTCQTYLGVVCNAESDITPNDLELEKWRKI